jgi:hypothetical protein
VGLSENNSKLERYGLLTEVATGIELTRAMQITGKPVPTSVGFFFIGFAVVAAVAILSGAKSAQSPLLFVSIFGGLFVGVPAALGIGVVIENRRKQNLDERNGLLSKVENVQKNNDE